MTGRPLLRFWPAAAVVIAAVFLTFGYSLTCNFVRWDDSGFVSHNSLIRHVTAASILHHWTTPSYGIYVPLTLTAWSLLGLVARVSPDEFGVPLNPMVFHAFNVLVHAGAAVAVLAILRRLFQDATAACVGALAFALHPFQVESVAWVSGLKDTLSGALALAAIGQYVAFRQENNGQRRWHYAGFLAFLALSLLAKPAAMTTPILVLIVDRLLIGTPWRRVIVALLPTALLVLPIMIVAKIVQPTPDTVSPLAYRPLIALDAIAFYAAKLFFPLGLTADYGRSPLTVIGSGMLWYDWLLPAGLFAAAIWTLVRTRQTAPLAALLIFIAAPLPVLGLVRFDFQRVSTVADHYMYVALLGPGCLVAWLIARAHYRRRMALATMGAILCAWAMLSWIQTTHWKDEGTLMHHTLATNPASRIAVTNLAHWYALNGDMKSARYYTDLGLERDRDNPIVHQNDAVFALHEGRPEHARAAFARWAELLPIQNTYVSIAETCLDFGDLRQAAHYLALAENLAPADDHVIHLRDRLRAEERRQNVMPATTHPHRPAI